MTSRADRIRTALEAAFAPAQVTVDDDSHRHAGHAGAAGGAGHYDVEIVSVTFRDLRPIARHRLVYDALADWMPHRVHALSIRATAPGSEPDDATTAGPAR